MAHGAWRFARSANFIIRFAHSPLQKLLIKKNKIYAPKQ
jgi:hypothetical protein